MKCWIRERVYQTRVLEIAKTNSTGPGYVDRDIHPDEPDLIVLEEKDVDKGNWREATEIERALFEKSGG